MLKMRYLYILLISILLSLFAIVKIGKATTSLSGSCGAMMSLKQLNEVYWHLGSTGALAIDGSSETISMDAMILLDFDKNKIYINVTNGTLTKNPLPIGTVATYATLTVPSIDFTLASGPLPNSYLLTDTSNTIPNLLLLPVNSGNTFLIQAKNSKATGVCQKI
jgi:hypothetical protein